VSSYGKASVRVMKDAFFTKSEEDNSFSSKNEQNQQKNGEMALDVKSIHKRYRDEQDGLFEEDGIIHSSPKGMKSTIEFRQGYQFSKKLRSKIAKLSQNAKNSLKDDEFDELFAETPKLVHWLHNIHPVGIPSTIGVFQGYDEKETHFEQFEEESDQVSLQAVAKKTSATAATTKNATKPRIVKIGYTPSTFSASNAHPIFLDEEESDEIGLQLSAIRIQPQNDPKYREYFQACQKQGRNAADKADLKKKCQVSREITQSYNTAERNLARIFG
jgi:hypothetical protein